MTYMSQIWPTGIWLTYGQQNEDMTCITQIQPTSDLQVLHHPNLSQDSKCDLTCKHNHGPSALSRACLCVFSDSGGELIIRDPVIKARELFISDVSDTYPVSTLR